MSTPTLTLSGAGIAPRAWTFGFPCREGDFPSTLRAPGAALQVDVRNRWGDGSVKLAVISGITAPGELVFVSDDDAPTGAAPVAAPEDAWLARNVRLTVDGDEFFPSASALVEKDFGHVMSEFVYVVPVRGSLTARWTIRVYANGAAEVETLVENSGVLREQRSEDYAVQVWVGGRKTFEERVGTPFWKTPDVRAADNVFRFPASSEAERFPEGTKLLIGGEEFTVVKAEYVSRGTNVTVDKTLPPIGFTVFICGHPVKSRWSRTDWIGNDAPFVPAFNPAYLMSTKLVPHFYTADGAPDSRRLSGLPVPDAPFRRGNYPVSMGASGTNSEPCRKEAAFFIKTQDARAWNSMIAHAHAAGRYGIFYRDETTGKPLEYAKFPKHVFSGSATFSGVSAATGSSRFPAGSGLKGPRYAKSHAPQLSYVAYILTGRRSFAETVEFQAQVGWWVCNRADSAFEGARCAVAAHGSFSHRAAAWSIRAMGEACVVLPDSEPRRAQYVRQLEKTLAYYQHHFVGKNALGAVTPSSGYSGGTRAFTAQATFQEGFFTVGVVGAWFLAGHLITDPRCKEFVVWRCGLQVGRTGTVASGYPYQDAASVYAPKLAVGYWCGPTKNVEFNANCYPTWLEAYIATYGREPETIVDPKLLGTSSRRPTTMARSDAHDWAIHASALAYAVDLGAPGARAAWDRMTSAPNWSPSGFRNYPDWGIVPRS